MTLPSPRIRVNGPSKTHVSPTICLKLPHPTVAGRATSSSARIKAIKSVKWELRNTENKNIKQTCDMLIKCMHDICQASSQGSSSLLSSPSTYNCTIDFIIVCLVLKRRKPKSFSCQNKFKYKHTKTSNQEDKLCNS